MVVNFARFLRNYEGETLILDWPWGLSLRVKVDTFEEGADNEDGLDSMVLDVLEVIRQEHTGFKAGDLLEVKENEPLVRIAKPSGDVVWPSSD